MTNVVLPNIAVAVGIITRPNQEFLIAQRPSHKYLGGFWEFPGGKIEPGETAEQALHRELQEEVGIQVKSYSLLTSLTHTYPQYSVNMSIYEVDQFLGEAESREQQLIRWVNFQQLSEYDFLDANGKIIEALQKKYSTE